MKDTFLELNEGYFRKNAIDAVLQDQQDAKIYWIYLRGKDRPIKIEWTGLTMDLIEKIEDEISVP